MGMNVMKEVDHCFEQPDLTNSYNSESNFSTPDLNENMDNAQNDINTATKEPRMELGDTTEVNSNIETVQKNINKLCEYNAVEREEITINNLAFAKDLKCNECELSFSDQKELNRHELLEECYMNVDKEDFTSGKEDLHLNTSNGEKEEIRCMYCEFICDGIGSFIDHINRS